MLLEEVVRRVTSRELPQFAREAVFAPLGMNDTTFLPPEELRQRVAWTEYVDGEWRAGVVHDPRAYLLGGVAGHAGLFSTADDLALYARAILGGGAVDGRRMLSPETVATMIAPHDVPGGIRALGWSIESQWRGDGLSPRAIGHLGYTGTALWIDPDKDLFTIVLTNRVHPDGKGDSKPLLARVNTLVAAAIGPPAGRVACPDTSEGVLTGIDVLRAEGFERLKGMRVGLITNASGRARDGTSTVDLLLGAPGVKLAALFTPEHGLDAAHAGKIGDSRDDRSGLPVYSLYGDAFAPSAGSLTGIDTLVFDVQDVGVRFFTYAATMRQAMKAAREHDVRFIVLDRPNPIDGIDVAGPVLVPPTSSFVNYHSLPIRHGMTMGELATLLNADERLGVALSVVTMRGWRRDAYGDETGLPWTNPSPEPPERRRGRPLSGHRPPRGDEPRRGPRHGRALRTDRRAVDRRVVARRGAGRGGAAWRRLHAGRLHARRRPLRGSPLPRRARHGPRSRAVRARADRSGHRAGPASPLPPRLGVREARPAARPPRGDERDRRRRSARGGRTDVPGRARGLHDQAGEVPALCRRLPARRAVTGQTIFSSGLLILPRTS